MKILMISTMLPYLPCYDGFRLVPAHLMRELSKRHEIHLMSFSSGEESEAQLKWPERYCASVKVMKPLKKRGLLEKMTRPEEPFPRELIQAVGKHMDFIAPDVIHLEGPLTAPLAHVARSRALTLLSAHDSLYLRYQDFARFGGSFKLRGAHKVRSMMLKRYEKRWYKNADRVVVTSRSDMEALGEFVPSESLAAIPNGVDFDYLAYRPTPTPGRIVFTGNMSWTPNVDAVEYFTREIFPAVRERFSHAEFWIVGADPSERVLALKDSPGVRVTGTVSDIREWVWRASVYVSPLRFGVGCKNKILEAMSLGTPIVATPKSLTGTHIEDGLHLLVAESAEEIKEAVIKLLDDEELRIVLSSEARRLVEVNYSWKRVAGRFENLYVPIGSKVALRSIGCAG